MVMRLLAKSLSHDLNSENFALGNPAVTAARVRPTLGMYTVNRPRGDIARSDIQMGSATWKRWDMVDIAIVCPLRSLARPANVAWW